MIQDALMNVYAKKLMELDDYDIAALYKNLFNSPDGQLVLEHLKQRCFEYDTTDTDPLCPYTIKRNEGIRSLMIHIKTQMSIERPPKLPSEEEQPSS